MTKIGPKLVSVVQSDQTNFASSNNIHHRGMITEQFWPMTKDNIIQNRDCYRINLIKPL